MNKTQAVLKVGDITDGEVYKITKFGAFVKLPLGGKGLIHISQVSDSFVENISEHLKIGDKVRARIVAINGLKIDLTLKLKEYTSSYPKDKDFRSSDFEEKLKGYLSVPRKVCLRQTTGPPNENDTMRGGAAR